MKKKTILESFPISNEEYKELVKKYQSLCYYAAWQLNRKNTRNNHQNDIDDFEQEMMFAVIKAGSYFKRQVFIEKSLEICKQFAKDRFFIYLLSELQDLWNNRTRHGANRQKFGWHQEKLLQLIVRATVPKSLRPSHCQCLEINSKFGTYCKQIIWNQQRAMGKKITKEKPLRAQMTSLSEFQYLGGC